MQIISFPADGSAEVDPASSVSTAFSLPMSESTFTTETFRVLGPGGAVRGSVHYGLGKAIFLPAEPLPLASSFTAVLSKGLRDREGNALAEDFTWRFRTRDGRWSDRLRLSAQVRAAGGRPSMALSPDGTVMIVWAGEGNAGLFAHTFVPGRGWGAAIPVSGEGRVADPCVVADTHGNFTVVWEQDLGTRSAILARGYQSAVAAWEEILTLEARPGRASHPYAAASANGDVLVAWEYRDGGTSSLVYARWLRTRAGFLDASPEVLTPERQEVSRVRVATGGEGLAAAVWQQWDGARYDVWANLYDPVSSRWQAKAMPLEQGEGLASDPDVLWEEGGGFVASWTQWDGTAHRRFSRRYHHTEKFWGEPVTGGSREGGPPANLQVTDRFGRTTEVSVEKGGEGYDVWVRRCE